MKTTLKWRVAQKLERIWWRRYLKNQTPQEYKAWKSNYWQKFFGIVAETVALKNEDIIIDLGCGPAGIYSIFNNNNVVAVDPLLDTYEQDLVHFNKIDYPYVQFVNSSIEAFNTNQKFELVCCLNAINHVSNIELAFEKLGKLTKPNGYCLLSIDAHNHQFLKHLFRAIPGDALHPHQYDLKEYEQMMIETGFEIIKTHLYKPQPIFNYYLLLAKKR